MALRQTTQTHTTEANLRVLYRAEAMHVDAMKDPAHPDETAIHHSNAGRSLSSIRNLRSYFILANALAWIVIAFAVWLALF